MKFWDDWVDVEDMEAMWNHPEVRDEWLRVGEERGMKVHLSRNFDGKPYVTHTEMKVNTQLSFYYLHFSCTFSKIVAGLGTWRNPHLSCMLCSQLIISSQISIN